MCKFETKNIFRFVEFLEGKQNSFRQDLVALYTKAENHLKLSKILFSMISQNRNVFSQFLNAVQKIKKDVRFDLAKIATPVSGKSLKYIF